MNKWNIRLLGFLKFLAFFTTGMILMFIGLAEFPFFTHTVEFLKADYTLLTSGFLYGVKNWVVLTILNLLPITYLLTINGWAFFCVHKGVKLIHDANSPVKPASRRNSTRSR